MTGDVLGSSRCTVSKTLKIRRFLDLVGSRELGDVYCEVGVGGG